MCKTRLIALSLASAAGITASLHAELVTATITADNHYALYSASGSTMNYHGGNELGASGAPGTYNWSMAETYSFDAGDTIYLAVWSDDAVAQGVLAEFQSASLGTALSGDPRWQVFGTGLNRGDNDPHPLASEIATQVSLATLGSGWETPFVGGVNGVAPWGGIAGISSEARWMWIDVPGDDDPLNGGSGARELLIYRMHVPGPGSLALLGAGGLLGLRRRRA